ncbi:hypothetical protein OGM63_17180 [Plectonema radiosum NIES-515]|uniref:Uncharacterized protein n=1 Tax=Plectonema radiosum NIES-515 TaxID=2986073 RepID=A0ABT3B1H3_9CYAN|nr:hypothetical protein [Plectonema radiosum]MCV3215224.1 hypothetical protein [Plectonema radiosum NIES-515]
MSLLGKILDIDRYAYYALRETLVETLHVLRLYVFYRDVYCFL